MSFPKPFAVVSIQSGDALSQLLPASSSGGVHYSVDPPFPEGLHLAVGSDGPVVAGRSDVVGVTVHTLTDDDTGDSMFISLTVFPPSPELVAGEKSLGQIAYEAYRRACPVSKFTGDPLPAWEDIDHELVPYWEAVGQAVAQHVNGSMQALVAHTVDGEGSAAMRQAIAFERLATVGERLADGPIAQLIGEVLGALREEQRLHGS